MDGITREWIEKEIKSLERMEAAASIRYGDALSYYQKAREDADHLKEELECCRAMKQELQWHLDNME